MKAEIPLQRQFFPKECADCGVFEDRKTLLAGKES
jgi:hypothetical protein